MAAILEVQNNKRYFNTGTCIKIKFISQRKITVGIVLYLPYGRHENPPFSTADLLLCANFTLFYFIIFFAPLLLINFII